MSDKRCEGCGSINPHIHFKGCAKVQQEHYAKLPTPEPQEAAPQPNSTAPESADDYRPSAFHLSNSEVRASGMIAGGAYQNIARELLELRLQITKLRAEIERKDKWISVEDEMPPERELVLASTTVAGIMLSSWFCWFPEKGDPPLWHNALKEFGPVTHWQPLPPAPNTK